MTSNAVVQPQSQLAAQGQAIKLPKEQRVFVHRALNMGKVRAIGYDLDHTLALYDRVAFETLAFRETVKKFVLHGYPEELLELSFDPTKLQRGLLVDMDRGNVLKVDAHKYVKVAYHGHRRLSKEERQQTYNNKPYKAGEFVSVDTFFALSEVQLFTEIVDYMDRNKGHIEKSYREVYADLRWLIDLAHADGSIKDEVQRDIGRFIKKDRHLAPTLARQIDAGKSLFLLTNSAFEYTDQLLNYIFDDAGAEVRHWRDLFEYTICGSGKPGFFAGSQPFYEVMTDSGLLKRHSGNLVKGGVYHGGNARLFEKLSGYVGDEILFVGDHIYGDLARSKGAVNWRTLLVIEELSDELEKLEEQREALEQIRRMLREREILDEELQLLRSKVASNNRQAALAKERGETKKSHYLQKETEKIVLKAAEKESELQQKELQVKEHVAQRESAFHPQWGELMRAGLERSRFADQVEEYACIYTSRVTNLRFYSPFKRFSIPSDSLPHEL